MHTHLIFTVIGFHTLVVTLPAAALTLYLRPGMVHLALAFFIGLLVGFIDGQGAEIQFTVLLLLTFGLFLGFLWAERPWLTALLLSVWIPVMAIGKILAGAGSENLVSEGLASLMALLPAFAGVYAGRSIRFSERKASSHTNNNAEES